MAAIGETTMQLIALVHEENGFYGVSFPDFPGCTTVGETLDEAMRKAPAALAFHIAGLSEDGVALPVLRTITQITRDPEFGDVIADAMVAVVPYDSKG
jgi:predicted RNase H-like HicB family nuclease